MKMWGTKVFFFLLETQSSNFSHNYPGRPMFKTIMSRKYLLFHKDKAKMKYMRKENVGRMKNVALTQKAW